MGDREKSFFKRLGMGYSIHDFHTGETFTHLTQKLSISLMGSGLSIYRSEPRFRLEYGYRNL